MCAAGAGTSPASAVTMGMLHPWGMKSLGPSSLCLSSGDPGDCSGVREGMGILLMAGQSWGMCLCKSPRNIRPSFSSKEIYRCENVIPGNTVPSITIVADQLIKKV